MHVHPLPSAGHSWRDFVFHMATIAAGLLLALALEHAAEVWHESGQRQQLAADLREEGLRNRGYLEGDGALLDASLAWLDRAGAAVRAARTGAAVAYPPAWDEEMRRTGRVFGVPTAAVWSTASSTGAVRLLPREDAFAYARLYFIHDLVVAIDVERRRAVAAVRAAEAIAGVGSGAASLADAGRPELDRLLAAIAAQQAVEGQLRTLLVGYRSMNESVLAGDRFAAPASALQIAPPAAPRTR